MAWAGAPAASTRSAHPCTRREESAPETTWTGKRPRPRRCSDDAEPRPKLVGSWTFGPRQNTLGKLIGQRWVQGPPGNPAWVESHHAGRGASHGSPCWKASLSATQKTGRAFAPRRPINNPRPAPKAGQPSSPKLTGKAAGAAARAWTPHHRGKTGKIVGRKRPKRRLLGAEGSGGRGQVDRRSYSDRHNRLPSKGRAGRKGRTVEFKTAMFMEPLPVGNLQFRLLPQSCPRSAHPAPPIDGVGSSPAGNP